MVDLGVNVSLSLSRLSVFGGKHLWKIYLYFLGKGFLELTYCAQSDVYAGISRQVYKR